MCRSSMNIISSSTDMKPAVIRDKEGPPPGYDLRPSRGLFDLELDKVWQSRELLGVLMMRDVQVLYRQAALAWPGPSSSRSSPSSSSPSFSAISPRSRPAASPMRVFAFAGVLPWTYFSEAVRRSATGLVTDSELVRKVYFPRLIIPLGGVISPLIEFGIGFVILLGIMLWYGILPTWHILAVVPLLGISGLWRWPWDCGSARSTSASATSSDTLPFMLQVWMYASPIVYPLDAWSPRNGSGPMP